MVDAVRGASDAVPRKRRRRTLVGIVAATIAVAVLAALWFVAARFESPAQRAAHAAPPTPSVITATVGEGDLTRVATTRVTIARAVQQTVPLSAGEGAGVVTAQPLAAGAEIAPGSVVSEVNGRPVIAVPGAFRFYRPLRVGSSGPDVAQLQRGLAAAGFDVGDDGRLGPGTARAIRALYERAGYPAPESDDSPQQTAPLETDGTTGEKPAPAARPPDPLALPPSELLVVGALPAFFVSAPAVDALIDDVSVVSVEAGAVVAAGTVDPSLATELRLGMSGTLTGPDGATTPVAVAAIGTTGGTGEPVPIRLEATGTPLDTALLHTEVLATLTLSIAARDSLLVPTTSVVTTGTQKARVLKLLPDGRFHEVTVTELGRMGGRSAIRPGTPGQLAAGDTVLVG